MVEDEGYADIADMAVFKGAVFWGVLFECHTAVMTVRSVTGPGGKGRTY